MENDKKECRAYFLERSVYKKLFAKIQEKYAGIGHFGGTFLLDDLTKEEKEQLGGFLQKDFSGQKNVRVTAKQMEKALQSSRFCNFTWKEICQGVNMLRTIFLRYAVTNYFEAADIAVTCMQ